MQPRNGPPLTLFGPFLEAGPTVRQRSDRRPDARIHYNAGLTPEKGESDGRRRRRDTAQITTVPANDTKQTILAGKKFFRSKRANQRAKKIFAGNCRIRRGRKQAPAPSPTDTQLDKMQGMFCIVRRGHAATGIYRAEGEGRARPI